MKLSIVITRYNEKWDVMKPLFDSLALQRGIDFDDIDIILVNDGDENLLTGREFQGYPFSVRELTKAHGGVSAARNFGLDHAAGDYVMFCDCDDMFINSLGLHLVEQGIRENPDRIASSFIEENGKTGDDYKITRRDRDTTFVHGKAFRRQFLIDNNIRFKNELTIHEDGYFNLLATVCAESGKEISTPFYLWKWNPNSTVRTDSQDYVLKTYDHLMKCRDAICEALNERGYIDKYFDAVCKTVIDSYYDFNKSNALDPKNKELVEEAERAFKKFYVKYRKDYNEANINRIAELMYVSRTQAFTNGLKVEQQTITEWLSHIMNDI